jgi:ferritin-like metal-binding protein YciE
MESLQDLLMDELSDLHSAETQLVKALPKLAKTAASPELRAAFEEHLGITQEHVDRLDQIFADMDSKPKRKTCKGMQGLIEEGKELIEEAKEPSPVLDAGLIGGAQRVEHYEISAYGTARAHAEELGMSDVAKLLEKTMHEEAEADEKLTKIAERGVNRKAA